MGWAVGPPDLIRRAYTVNDSLVVVGSAPAESLMLLALERMRGCRVRALERIEQLVQDLETLKRNWSILHPQQPFAGTVIIMADKNTDYRVVKKVMFSAAQAGYSNISFAVNRTGGE